MTTEQNDFSAFAPPALIVKDRQSLIHLGSLDSFDITEGGKQAARLILDFLDGASPETLEQAIQIYEEIIPNENFGGEYTALEWMCKYFLADETRREAMRAQPMIDSFQRMMTDSDCDNLRTYLQYKYHILEYGPGDQTALKARMRFLEDFILFCNPDRERWETTRDNLEKINLKKGAHLADVGCGPGYYSFRFSRLIGDEGKVYAIETNPLHLNYLRDYVSRYNVSNVDVIEGSFEGIGLPPHIKVDVVYICSLYHNVYAAFTDEERDAFVGSIRRALRENGQLIIVDNDLVTEGELPYHGPYISRDMIISQLWHYGFRLRDAFQFTPQRYLLLFDMTEIPPEGKGDNEHSPADVIYVNDAASLVRYRIIGTSTSGYTPRGKRCGRLMYEGLKTENERTLQEAYQAFNALYPLERVGDDYTALMWFISYRLADASRRVEMTADPFVKFYADYFVGNDFERLKTYLFYKFHLELPDPDDDHSRMNYEYSGGDFPVSTLNEWNELLIFNNPNRFLWEKTEEMLEYIHVRQGETVADIGCGGGGFSWRFSQTVGASGLVYATEINKDALSHLESFIDASGVKNIRTVVAKMNDISLPENSLDMAFMCSMYHAVYITDIEFVKDAFIESLRRALKADGRLVVVDNAITPEGVPSYYGPGIFPKLVIAQLKRYGFDLLSSHAFVPQRYVLIFGKNPAYIPPVQEGSVLSRDAQNQLQKLL